VGCARWDPIPRPAAWLGACRAPLAIYPWTRIRRNPFPWRKLERDGLLSWHRFLKGAPGGRLNQWRSLFPAFLLVGLLLFSPWGSRRCAADPVKGSIGCEAANQKPLPERQALVALQTSRGEGAGFTRR